MKVARADAERAHRFKSGVMATAKVVVALAEGPSFSYLFSSFSGLLDQRDFDWLLHLEDHLIADGTWGNVGCMPDG